MKHTAILSFSPTTTPASRPEMHKVAAWSRLRLSLPFILLCFISFLRAAPGSFRLEAELDRSAFYVGEMINYRVAVFHDPSSEFILERFNEQSLHMDPFQVKHVSVSDSNGLLQANLQLVCYEINFPKRLEVPAITLYYATKRGAAAVNPDNVMTFTVRPMPIAFRSALPEGAVTMRDGMPAESPLMPFFWATLFLGVSGLIAAFVPVAGFAYRRIRHGFPQREVDKSEARARLTAVIRRLPQDARDAGAVTAFYETLAAEIREYAGKLAGKPGRALTPAELAKALTATGVPAQEAGRFADLVALADQVRYSPCGLDRGTKMLAEVRQDAMRVSGNGTVV